MMDCQSATCDFCHMSYCLNIADDVRQHEKHHQHCLDSYQQALIKYKNTTIRRLCWAFSDQ